MGDIVISFRDVVKTYPSYHQFNGGIKNFIFHLHSNIKEMRKRFLAINGLSLDIKRGENFAFIGRNGAGKSTLLGLMAGVLKPDSGEISVHGRISPLLSLGAGFHPELTGRENILLNGVLLGLSREKVLSRIDEIIAFSELEAFIDQPVRTYSSGMYSKLGFSVVTILDPEILLLDEVLAVGDVAFVEKCKKSFDAFRSDKNVTMVLVSHSLPMVAETCDRAAWIHHKKVRALGPSADVVSEYMTAMMPKVDTPATITAQPAHVSLGVCSLDASSGAVFKPRIVSEVEEPTIRISLLRRSDGAVIRDWTTAPQPMALSHEEDGWLLTPRFTDRFEPVPIAPNAGNRADEEDDYALMRVWAEKDGRKITPPIHTAVVLDQTSRTALETERGRILFHYGANGCERVPAWPAGMAIRIVARNLFCKDGIGAFVLGLAGLLTSAGLRVQLYAYVFDPALSGFVQSISDLENDAKEHDLLIYNWSIEDEFLSTMTSVPCKKLLYYHNVTPGAFFEAYDKTFAAVLDRSTEQYEYFKLFDAVLANSEYSLENIRPYLDTDVYASHCPPTLNPARLTSVTPEPVKMPDTNRFLFWISRMAPHKRPTLAIDIFAELAAKDDNIGLVMVGGGRNDFPSQAAQIEEALAQLPKKVRARCALMEGVSDSKLAFLYSRATVLLATSAHEGFGLPLMEAMGAGLPVVATSQPAVEEVLDGAGMILPDDPAAAATALGELLNDASRLETLKQEGVARAETLYAMADGSVVFDAAEAALARESDKA
ncbi:glycosyltransferase [Oceanidesulfovibrio marinus]|uniref:ABC transporter domain-containing protein n=1 Tax=Oceanidesulfovibrio marinus TaxID=370038 RepID=A0A6P1ZLV0_9BACT|nr:glycosyltransferase [Oceanidesulfovibrio marinus]TVM36074.1 hypothetical protein DQK91_05370 [Oceanidesulfovibrio marinus]